MATGAAELAAALGISEAQGLKLARAMETTIQVLAQNYRIPMTPFDFDVWAKVTAHFFDPSRDRITVADVCKAFPALEDRG